MESIRLNNIAASMLCSGKHEASLSYLQHALQTLRVSVSATRERSGGNDAPCFRCRHNHQEGHDLKMVEEEEGATAAAVAAAATALPTLDISAAHDGGKLATFGPVVEGAFEFYDKVLVVSCDGCCCPSQLTKVQNMLLAVITYNLGSVSQRMGIKYGPTWHFAKAMKFYQLSFSTIENILQDFGFDSNLVLLLCGLYNNMGHIYARANDVEETQFCLTWLQRTVNSDEFNTCPAMCEEDYGFFSQYLMFCDPQKQFSSAPAA